MHLAYTVSCRCDFFTVQHVLIRSIWGAEKMSCVWSDERKGDTCRPSGKASRGGKKTTQKGNIDKRGNSQANDATVLSRPPQVLNLGSPHPTGRKLCALIKHAGAVIEDGLNGCYGIRNWAHYHLGTCSGPSSSSLSPSARWLSFQGNTTDWQPITQEQFAVAVADYQSQGFPRD